MEGVSRLILLPILNASHLLALHAAVCRLGHFNAVRRHLRTADEVAADAAPSYWAGALGAAIINKVRVSLLHFAILESSINAVVVLVAFTRASYLQTRGTASPTLQNFFNTVLQLGTVDGRAVGLAQAHTQVEIQKSGS